MSRLARKLGAMTLALMLTATLSGGSVFAFECYNASRSAQGNQSAANGQALVSPSFILVAFCGLTEEEAQDVLDELEVAGYETDILINGRAFMAGGLLGKEDLQHLLHDGRGIDHLSHDFFELLLELAPSCGEEPE